jgi:DNA-binding transcriptional ArsR family regulator
MEEKFLIDKETLKAIAVDTRLNILKILSKKRCTLTEISDMLGLGNSTVSEHLGHLAKAGLIEREETDRKWKYYSLTLKGRRFVEPRAITVLFMFGLSAIAAIGYAIWFAKEFLFTAKEQPMLAARGFMGAYESAAEDMVAAAAPEAERAVAEHASLNPVLMMIILVILVGISAFLLGHYMKRKLVIIQKGERK